MSSLLTNASAQTALQTLRNVQGNLQETQDRISTGLKVRSPKENPAFFLVAQTVRGDLAVLNGLRDNLTIGVNAAKTASSGIDGITGFINTIQESLTSAEGGAALNEIQFAINEVVGQIEGQVEGTNFNGVNLLKGVNTTTVTTTVIREAGQFKLSTFTLQAQNLDSLELAGEATGIYTTAQAQTQFDAVYRAFNPGLAFRLDSNGDGDVDLTNGGADDLGVGAGGNSFTFYGSDSDVEFLTSIGITATNAIKYGSLSQPGGAVSVSWKTGDAGLELDWIESGGPPTTPPETQNFGSRLVASTARQLNASINHDWREDGLHVSVVLPHE